jgi:hypothetical protein
MAGDAVVKALALLATRGGGGGGGVYNMDGWRIDGWRMVFWTHINSKDQELVDVVIVMNGVLNHKGF